MRIAEIDLADKSVSIYDFDNDISGGVWGGRCLGLGLLARNSSVREPLDPESPLVVSIGSLVGTGFPLGNRLTMVFRSPLTRTVAWTHTGGYAASELASLGYSAFYIKGRCEKLSTIKVDDSGITIAEAEYLRGRGAVETCAAIRAAVGDARVLSIGPAGEGALPIATVVNDMGRTSGVRHGVGAVFGSKNIKAIVIRSKRRSRPHIHQPTLFAQLLRRLKNKIESSHLLNLEKGLLAVHGTAIAVEALGENEAIPVKNYTYTALDNYGRVGGVSLSSTVLVARLTCSLCPVSCRRETIGYGVRGEGPDYAQISSIGTNFMIFDHEKIAYLTQLCYDAGMDPIEMGNTLAVYADLSEKGYVEKTLNWSDFEAASHLIRQTATGENIGAILAHGAFLTAKTFGDDYLAPSVKNISIQNTDPRVENAWGLVNAVESFGGGVHIWVYPEIVKSFKKLGIETIFDDEPTPTQVAERVYRKQAEVAALDSLGVCAFSKLALTPKDYVEGLAAVYGHSVDETLFSDVGFKVLALERHINELYGFNLNQDTLPKKFIEEPLPIGKHKGAVCPIEDLLGPYHKMLRKNSVSKFTESFPKLR